MGYCVTVGSQRTFGGRQVNLLVEGWWQQQPPKQTVQVAGTLGADGKKETWG